MVDSPITSLPESVLLSNGSRVAFLKAVRLLSFLEELAQGDSGDRALLQCMREASLGNPLPEKLTAQLHEPWDARSVEQNLDLKALILSSVRGTQGTLHVDSPFTTFLDETMARTIISIDRVADLVGPEAAEAILRGAWPTPAATDPTNSARGSNWRSIVHTRGDKGYSPD
jgi:hypothetical protein